MRSHTENSLPRFKDNYRQGDMPSARMMNALARLFNGAKAHDGIWLKLGANGLHIGGGGRTGAGGFPWHLMRFGYRLFTEESQWKLEVKAGSIRTLGVGTREYDGSTTLTLETETVIIFAQNVRASSTVTVEQSATDPTSTATTVRLPLYTFARSGEEGSYSYALQHVHHMGDFYFDAPIF